MAKVEKKHDNLSPASTFNGPHVVKITSNDGKTVGRGRAFTEEKARERAENDYDTKRRGS